MTADQIDTIHETAFSIQRLRHIMSIIVESFESETMGLQKIERTSYVGSRMDMYLSALVIILDHIINAEETLSACFKPSDSPTAREEDHQ